MHYYFWIPVAILLIVGLLSDEHTWSLFQSDQVKEICAHMTPQERRASIKRAVMWGALIGIVPGLTAVILSMVVFESALVAVLACAAVFPLAGLALLPHARRSQQRFLASTEWARSQGIEPDDIRLYRWNDKA